MREDNIKAVEAYLNALKHNDLSLAPFADEIIFENPVSGKNKGAENFRAFLSGFLPAIDDVRVLDHICEGDRVVTHWEVDGVFGVVTILEKFRVRDGLITEAFGYFDPRPILGS
jgi:limonene-1,2-epoxide hydrolase